MKSKWIIVLMVLLLPYLAVGQKPAWTKGFFYSTPYSDVKSFDAKGRTEPEALNNALAEVVRWKSGETGLRSQLTIENGVMVVSGSDNISVKAREIGRYYEKLSSNEIRAYVLVQIAKTPAVAFDNIEPTILKKIGKTTKPSSPFFEKGHNNYLAWGVLNTGYPVTLGTSFAGRHGGIVGIGYYLSLGIDIGGNSTYERYASEYQSVYKPAKESSDAEFIIPIHYAVGLKIFPYKSFFLSAGYGTLGCEKMSRFNDSAGRWGMEGWRQGKGLILTGGYDILSDLKNFAGDSGLFLSLGAGMSYDLFMEKWQPLINIKFGMAWGL